MRIALIGSRSIIVDEGMKKISLTLHNHLVKILKGDVLLYDPFNLTLKPFVKLVNFRPDIIHYIPGPSIQSFLFLKFLKTFFLKSKTILSSPMPQLSSSISKFLPLLAPNLLLAQSQKYNQIFTNIGINSNFQPISGVDLDKFRPIDHEIRVKIRKKFGFSSDDFLILHVGHITKGRNLDSLLPLLKLKKAVNTKIRILIISSPSTNIDQRISKYLSSSGIMVYRKYVPNIELIYAISDCYIFPTVNEFSCIQIPLSILEAMAVNLRVITTRFGGLPDIFSEGNGLHFIDDIRNKKEILNIISNVFDEKIETRKKVNDLSWEKITKNLITTYSLVLNDTK